MDNKYLYLSSLDSVNHSDWECQFSNQIMIKPYSQVRLISAHINIRPNSIVINKANNVFYVGVDFWNKMNSVIPLLPVIIPNGNYFINDVSEMREIVNEKVGEALSAYCYLRGGMKVDLLSDDSLRFKLSGMQLYGCPTVALTDDVLEYWVSENYRRSVKALVNGSLKTLENNAAIATQVDDTYYGIETGGKANSYFSGPAMVTGLTGATSDAKHLACIVELDLTAHAMAQGEYIQTWFGPLRNSSLGPSSPYLWGNTLNENEPSSFNLANRFAVQIENGKLVVMYSEIVDGEIVATPFVYNGATDKLFQIVCQEWDDEYGSNYKLTVQHYDGSDWQDLLDVSKEQNSASQYDFLTTSFVKNGQLNLNSLGFICNCDDDNFSIIFTCAADDLDEEYGFNKTTGEYGARSSLNANINRPITVITDITNPKSENMAVSDDMLEIMNSRTVKSNDDVFYTEYYLTNGIIPNANWMGVESYGIQVINKEDDDTYDTYTVGMELDEPLSANKISFPQAYLEIKDLPLNNYTGNYLKGSIHKFISPIDFYPGGDDNSSKYTSRVYTEQFITLGNSSTMNLSSMRVRICDINGVTIPLDEYTIVTIEIRDNPYLRRDEQNERFLRGIVDKINAASVSDNIQKSGF